MNMVHNPLPRDIDKSKRPAPSLIQYGPLEEVKQQLKKVKEISCSEGNWNYDPYMHGMANGLILALAIVENKDPVYLKAPDVWLCDVEEKPVCSVSEENLKGCV